ncbi:glycerol-1-phosphate dehydrogenase [NAD(P)+] [Alkalihalobacillus xiaoxiensis]|uniref:Glycerol-1-phosphate dehydrogenase [NAD(P)+] n=1 Tax=Shouchella xiaoxiensis TaxID=766895 RepID=A0ABS2SMW3_9BACI|nr:sn-glycerol-1-phosphate dehydrogenase [Shouchella xiaoxiensis]MBM7836848.1 glycerol-1-phosphate dehydrogenase [NAD(P)+] [Shouchella xiaoxiensis]
MNLQFLQERINQSGEKLNPLPLETIVVEKEAFKKAAAFIAHRAKRRVLLVADTFTYAAAGKQLIDLLLTEKVLPDVHLVKPNKNGDVLADEVSLVDLFLSLKEDTDLLVAVGSGTIHDLVRFISGKSGKPFVSIPTAPSVDGFTSLGAPIVVRGEKKTYQLVAPMALFADTAVLQQAPTALVAAGFGDMIGKYTSLLDWRIGSIVKNEPYSPLVAELTREALDGCVDHVDEIAAKTEEGVQRLMEALLLSGLAMALFGYSHPASGAEHHLSHYWEMKALEKEEKQLLHGAKVGRSTLVITQFYKETIVPELPELMGVEHIQQVRQRIEELPSVEFIQSQLERVGWTKELVPIPKSLIEQSLREAHLLRDRYTLLRLYNDYKGGRSDAYRTKTASL